MMESGQPESGSLPFVSENSQALLESWSHISHSLVASLQCLNSQAWLESWSHSLEASF